MNFQDLVFTPFHRAMNAIYRTRKLTGDISEIVNKVMLNENIALPDEADLREVQLREQGHPAREMLLNDWRVLKTHGASPTLNLPRCCSINPGKK